MFALIFGITVIAIMLAGGIWAYHSDKKIWNLGMCPKCYSEWEIRDTDSQGGRMLRCPTCDNGAWISYPVERKRRDYPLRLTTRLER